MPTSSRASASPCCLAPCCNAASGVNWPNSKTARRFLFRAARFSSREGCPPIKTRSMAVQVCPLAGIMQKRRSGSGVGRERLATAPKSYGSYWRSAGLQHRALTGASASMRVAYGSELIDRAGDGPGCRCDNNRCGSLGTVKLRSELSTALLGTFRNFRCTMAQPSPSDSVRGRGLWTFSSRWR